MDVIELLERATLLHRSGKLEEARRLYLEASKVAPQAAEPWHRLGLIAQATGGLDDAARLLGKAIELDQSQPLYFFGLGVVLQDQKKMGAAAESFRRALALDPRLAPAHNHLGLVLRDEQRYDEALQCFREAVRHQPGYARAFNNLGSLLRATGKLAEAVDCFREAVRLNPDYRLALVNLGKAQQESSDLAGAEESYRRAAKIDPNDFEIWSGLGSVQVMQVRLEQAEHSLMNALVLKPDSLGHLIWLGHAQREQGKVQACTATQRRALVLDPDNLQALLADCLALPPLYASLAAVDAARANYAEGLARLRLEAERFKRLPATQVIPQMQWVNFFLAYQGQDDRALQTQYAAVIADIASAVAPEYFAPIARDKDLAGRKLRLGFVSTFLRQCTVGSYFKSWITLLDKERFEVFVYYTGHWRDPVTREIEASVDHYAQLTGAQSIEIAQRVKADRLDALIYPEMGMDGAAYLLGAMRLAPVQCVAWGHPVTTGHKNIDCYLSCAAMEPEDAQEQYAEPLVLLSGVGTCYSMPACPANADRRRLSLPEDRHLYLCPQSLYKIHPDNDEIFLEILEQDEKATLVFFQGMFAAVTQGFMERLKLGMSARKLPLQKRVVFLPRMDHDSYLLVNRSCDVMLDTLHWSGGNTSLDALACALPVVTLPGTFMRGRQSYAMLKALALEELIARDKDDYVAIALRLATDSAWRQEIRRRIAQNIDALFGERLPIRELEKFLLSRFDAGVS